MFHSPKPLLSTGNFVTAANPNALPLCASAVLRGRHPSSRLQTCLPCLASCRSPSDSPSARSGRAPRLARRLACGGGPGRGGRPARAAQPSHEPHTAHPPHLTPRPEPGRPLWTRPPSPPRASGPAAPVPPPRRLQAGQGARGGRCPSRPGPVP